MIESAMAWLISMAVGGVLLYCIIKIAVKSAVAEALRERDEANRVNAQKSEPVWPLCPGCGEKRYPDQPKCPHCGREY